MNPRLAAAQVLSKIIRDKHSLTTALEYLPKTDKNLSLIKELCFGVCRYYWFLQAIVKKLMIKPLKETDLDLEILLYLGIYQLNFLRIPEHAAIFETVEVTRLLKKNWASNLVNAILRNFLRQKQVLLADIQKDDKAYYSHPNWLIELIKHDWPSNWQSILTNNNLQAPLSLRVNQQKITNTDYLKLLHEYDISAEASTISAVGIRLAQAMSVQELPYFNEGYVSVQDEAAQLAAEFLQLQPNLLVLDACAAPGGKSAHLLEIESSIQLLAIDIDKQRTQKIHDNFKRLKLIGEIKTADILDKNTYWDGELFDRILCDAPCSATGVIRRHPDIKLLRRESDIEPLTIIQLKILSTLWTMLKNNGLLLYATCSVLTAENDQVIDKFITMHADVKIVKLTHKKAIPTKYGLQFLPEQNGVDGFFYALLQKS